MPEHQGVIYGLDDKPPFGRAVVLAVQHVLTMFGSTVAVPLLLAPAMGMGPSETALLISSVMLCSGVATLIQSTLGSRLPIIQGVSFSFLAAFSGVIIPTVLKPVAEGGLGGDGAMCMRYIAGAVILGAVAEMAIGFSGLMGLVRKCLSPVTVGPVIMLIGLALYQAGAPVAASDWPISLLTMALIILFSLVLAGGALIFRLFPMLLAILSAVGVCGLLTLAGVYGEGHAARVTFDQVSNAEWFRTTTVFFPWGMPAFSTAFVVAVLAGYLASIIESFGDYHACSHMAGGGEPTPEQVSRGIGCEGAACALTGVLGGFSSTSYSENVGLVGLTKVGSRYVVQIGGVLLVTPLLGADGEVYAVSQGPVAVGGFSAGGDAATIIKGVPTVGRISNGAIVEREIGFNLAALTQVHLSLRNPDLTTARRIAQAINGHLGVGAATALDPATVRMDVARSGAASTVDLITDVEQLVIETDQPARVVIDEGAGIIVMGADVRVDEVAIAQGNLTVRVTETPQVSQPNAFSENGETVVVPRTDVQVDEGEDRQLAVLNRGVSLQELVDGLNRLGVGPRDLISILQNIKSAGALQAEIVVQ